MVVLDFQQGDASGGENFVDDGDGDIIRHIENFDQDFFSGLDFGGMVDEDFGKFSYSGVFHDGSLVYVSIF